MCWVGDEAHFTSFYLTIALHECNLSFMIEIQSGRGHNT